MAKVNLSITVDNEHVEDFNSVVKWLKRAGMQVEEELGEIGVITGKIDSAKLPKLRRVKGVADVEEQRDFQLAPPESDIQ